MKYPGDEKTSDWHPRSTPWCAWRPWRFFLLLAILSLAIPSAATKLSAATLQLEDGRLISGDIGQTAGVADDPTDPTPSAGEVKTTPILILDDGLRRTYISKFRVRNISDETDEKPIKIRLWQNHADRGAVLGAIGRQLGVSPFDEFGRRIYEMQAPGGSLSVVQGITEVTPTYTRVRGLVAEPRNYVWDMRLATSSIPRQTLSRVLTTATPKNNVEARLQIVRLYLQSERYRDARDELQSIVKDFPEKSDLKDDIRQLTQLSSRRILDEIELLREAGQFQLVKVLLENFPSEEVAGATLERVRELLDEVNDLGTRRQQAIELLSNAVAGLKEPAIQVVAQEVEKEIKAELNAASLNRMTPLLQLGQGDDLDAEAKTALAISGWLLGSNQATDNLGVAVSLYDVRTRVLRYLREPNAPERERLLLELQDTEGGTVERVAELLKLIKPPLPVSVDAVREGGAYEFNVPILTDDSVTYHIQLPPEYDPLRSYPTILTLSGDGYPAETQLDFWAGPIRDNGTRRGQAMRHGYITIAVEWRQPGQFAYRYSAREHAAVLKCLRHAIRRFAIDADRVFLTGHDIGGDAVWDIALAHPDLWAGVMPILATADRYCGWYWENAEFLSWYFVDGELNGGAMAENARELDRYLKRPRFDSIVVEFLGRGHDSFSDEIQRLFDWMGRRKRQPPPKEFTTYTMRPWDNFFWWVEFEGLPRKAMVAPTTWPPARGVRAAPLRGRLYNNNKLSVVARAEKTTVWLSPEVVDFDKPLTVELNNRRITSRDTPVKPELKVLLEDARTRGDRQRPYWAKITAP